MPGCRVADDFNHVLGDPAEGRLATALRYRDSSFLPDIRVSGPAGRRRNHVRAHPGGAGRHSVQAAMANQPDLSGMTVSRREAQKPGGGGKLMLGESTMGLAA